MKWDLLSFFMAFPLPHNNTELIRNSRGKKKKNHQKHRRPPLSMTGSGCREAGISDSLGARKDPKKWIFTRSEQTMGSASWMATVIKPTCFAL